MPKVPLVAEKFRAALLAGEPNGCWIETPGPLDTPCWYWLGLITQGRGYGRLHIGGKSLRAHRFAFEVVNGPLGKLHALHRCDVRKCVRPSHLFAGTPGDNRLDAKAKGRLPCGESHSAIQRRGAQRRTATGETYGKLTREQVWQVYDRRKTGELLRTIAHSLGMSEAAISDICRGNTWLSERWLK